jgi:CRP-like cAMP-binding protein
VTQGQGSSARQLAVLGPGDFFGEMSLLGRVPRSATVRAITPLTVYVSNPREFFSLLEIAPSVADRITLAAANRLDANRAHAAAA